MLGRISFYKTNNDVRTNIHEKEKTLNKIQNQIATQKRVQELGDDPIAASHATRYSSLLIRKEVFSKQNRQVYDSLQLSEGYVREAVEIMQRSRELAVQAANGIYTQEDRAVMAVEIDQLLEELHSVANAQDADGKYIFGGTRTEFPPFRDIRMASNRMNKSVINTVEYEGNNESNIVEISDNDKVAQTLVGSALFWSGETRVQGGIDAQNFTVAQDSTIAINNVEIPVGQGDSIYAIINKINSSISNVQASLDPGTGALVITTNGKEQAWISDVQGTVLQDIGIINGQAPPYNTAGTTRVFSDTVFNTLIRLRDAMYENNYSDVGERVLGSVDEGLDSLLIGLSKMGAVTERLDIVYKRLDMKDIPAIKNQYANNMSIDLTDAVRRMNEASLAQQAVLAMSTRIMNTTLLNFLK